jgi:hypothetical protein
MSATVYYTYVYLHPETKVPFYVGKGTNGRCNAHINAAHKVRIGSTESLCVVECRRLLNQNLMPIIEIVLQNVTETEAFQEEIKLINLYGRRCDETGSLVNLTFGGDGASGFKQSEEHIQKRVYKQLGKKRTEEQKQRMKLIANSPESRKRISDLFRGKPKTLEHRAKLSKTQKGKSITEELRRKISEGCIRNGVRPPIIKSDQHNRAKGGIILMPDGNELHFTCLASFCQERGLNVSSVRNTLAKKRPLKRGEFAGLMLLSRTE